MNRPALKFLSLLSLLVVMSVAALAQGDVMAIARIDAKQITVGDQAKLFIIAENNPKTSKLEWPIFPDSLGGGLEIVEVGKIDTSQKGDIFTYKQRLLITGFDSGLYKVPSFRFTVIPTNGSAFYISTDSFQLLVQTVAVDTTKEFKPIKGIMYVKSTWLDYIWYFVGGIIFLVLIIIVIIYFIKNKKVPAVKPSGPVETLQDKTLRLLAALDAKELWQKDKVKEYYIELSDIVRNYIEERFHTPALELTTDEFLYKAKLHRELQPYLDILTGILQTADLAKFAKAQPLPQEHFDAMENAKKFVDSSRPVIIPVQNETTI